jgi:hypothetical protein
MRITRNIIKTTILFLIVCLVMLGDLSAQDAKEIKNLVENQNYVFIAQTALPATGSSRPLSPEYTVKVSKDTIISDLPYFGRAYSAPIGKTDGGIKFTSNTFEYTKEIHKKGGWDILIKPKDASEVQQLSFSISENGYSTLKVISTNRQAISFYGYIKEDK